MTYILNPAVIIDEPLFLDLYGWAHRKKYCFGFNVCNRKHIRDGLNEKLFTKEKTGEVFINNFFVWSEIHDDHDKTVNKIGVADGFICPANSDKISKFCFVNQMIIDPRRQNEGHGRAFLKALIDHYFSNGISLMFKLYANQKAALHLLQRARFTKIDKATLKPFVGEMWYLQAPKLK